MAATRRRAENGNGYGNSYCVSPGGAVGGPTTGGPGNGPPIPGGGSELLGGSGFVEVGGGLGPTGLHGKQLSMKPAIGALLHPARNVTTRSATSRFMPAK